MPGDRSSESTSDPDRDFRLRWRLELAADPLSFQLPPELESPAAAAETLSSTYFDTPARTLERRGISLQVVQLGARRRQIVELGDVPLEQARLEHELSEAEPALGRLPPDALPRVDTVALSAELEPVFRVEHRQSELRAANEHADARLLRGELSAGDRRQPLLALELSADTPSALGELAGQLASTLPLRFSGRTLAEQGRALARGEPPGAEKAEPLELPRSLDCVQGFRAIGFSCLRQIARNQPGVAAHDGEALHQLRVGLRRLRAALSLFKQLLGDAQSEAIKAELRWATEQLGAARDYDVFVSEVGAATPSDEPHASELHALENALRERRDRAFAAAEAAVGGERYQRALLGTALWLLSGEFSTRAVEPQAAPARRRLRSFARKVLTRRVRSLGKRLARLPELAPPERHRLRIAVKKLRYAVDFFGSLFPRRRGRRKRLISQLKKLQDKLGRLNDISVHQRLTAELTGTDTGAALGDGARAAFALGVYASREEAQIDELLAAAMRSGAKLSELAPFWG